MRKYKRLRFWLTFIGFILFPAFAFLIFIILISIDKDQNFSIPVIFSPFFCYIIYLFIYRKIDKYLGANFGKCNTFGSPGYVKMKFPNWVDIFNLNPNRWSFPEITLEDIEYKYGTRVIAVEYENNTKRIFIYFDFLDWLRFRHWYKHTYRSQIKFKQEQIQNKEEAKILEIILQNAQNDIDKLRAQSEKEFNQGTKIIKEAIRYGN